MTDFDTALADFKDIVNDAMQTEAGEFTPYSEDLEEGYFHPLQQTNGSKFLKLVQFSGSQRHVYCFVDKKTGDIYKAATWKSRAKHARGNIFQLSEIREYTSSSLVYGGCWYIR